MKQHIASRALVAVVCILSGCAMGDAMDPGGDDPTTPTNDAGTRRDASIRPAGDAGRTDSGSHADTGSHPDTHVTPTPAPVDAGSPYDSGSSDPTPTPTPEPVPDPTPTGSFCAMCSTDSDCGDPTSRCLYDESTGEQFCGVDCSSGSCPMRGC